MKKILFVLLLAQVVFAASSMDFVSSETLSSCPCDPVTFKFLIHTPDASESFSISVTTPDGVSASAPQTVQSFSEKEFEVIVTSSCSMQQGDYFVKVKATGSKGSVLEKQGFLRVKLCTRVGVSMPSVQSVCPGDETKYLITVDNNGRFTENGVVSVDLDVSLFSMGSNSFDLSPGESKQFTMLVSIPRGFPPAQIPFKVTAVSDYSFKEAFSVLDIGGLQCSNLVITLPAIIEAQAGATTPAGVSFKNLGSKDDFEITLSCPKFTSIDLNKISLETGETTSGVLSVKPSASDSNKEFDCVVNAKSTRYNSLFYGKTKIVVKDFIKGFVKAVVSGNKVSACEGDLVEIEFEIDNTGRAASYDISLSGLPAFSDSALVSVGEASKKRFTVSSVAKQGAITVNAANEFVSSSATVLIEARDCYSSSVQASKTEVSVCPLAKDSVSIKVKNTGEKADSYVYSIGSGTAKTSLSKQSSQLNANAEDSVLLIVAPLESQYGSTEVISFKSQGRDAATTSITLRVPSKEVCFDLGLVIEQVKEVHKLTIEPKQTRIECEQCSTASLELLLKNTGSFDESVYLSTDTLWVFINPEEIVLSKGESKQLFLFFSPTAQIQPGEHSVVLAAGNQKASVKLKLLVNVVAFGEAGELGITVESIEETTSEEGVDSSPLSKISGAFTANASLVALGLVLLAGIGVFWFLLKKEKTVENAEEPPVEEVEEKPVEKQIKEKKKAKKKK
ncbi:MAG: hypothetical protein ABH803_04285 [Candidatus Micrarchaeota archaeon]